MISGLYTASKGMTILQQKVDTVTNNLANANTTGFKKALLVSSTQVDHRRNEEFELRQSEEQRLVERVISFEQGSMIQTDDNFDLAIQGKGFFEIETPDGIRFTRNGAFTLNAYSELVTLGGDFVLDSGGSHIKVGGEEEGGILSVSRGSFSVSRGGIISVDDIPQGKISLVDIENTKDLLQEGRGLYRISENSIQQPVRGGNHEVMQGMLEGSNVSSIESMVQLMRFQKNYETGAQAIQAINDTLGKAVNEIGKV